MSNLSVLIIEKNSDIRSLNIKKFDINELYKKCGFKKSSDFILQARWEANSNIENIYIELYAKENGRANNENKYEFPPPVDKNLFFGSCALVSYFIDNDNNKVYTNLTIELWNSVYETLFGGFEDLSKTAYEDEMEEDELANVDKSMLSNGYLKDDFVVDDAIENISLCSELSEESYLTDEEDEY